MARSVMVIVHDSTQNPFQLLDLVFVVKANSAVVGAPLCSLQGDVADGLLPEAKDTVCCFSSVGGVGLTWSL